MSNKLLLLLKLQFLEQSGLNQLRHERDRKKKLQAVFTFIAIFLLSLLLIGFCFVTAVGYAMMGMAELIPGIALSLTSLVIFVFTLLKAGGWLFASQDYDILMSLPIPVRTVITAKFLYLYLNNFLFSLCVMLPMGFIYMINRSIDTVLLGIFLAVVWFVAAALAPLLPMTVSAAVGMLAAAIGARTRFKVFFQAILSLLAVSAALGLNLFLNLFLNSSSDADEWFDRMENLGTLVQEKIYQIYPLSSLFDHALKDGSLLSFLGFILLSCGIYGIFVWVAGRSYQRIYTVLKSTGKKEKYVMKRQQKHSVLAALLYKEWKRLFSSVTYLLNTGIGILFALLTGIAAIFAGNMLTEDVYEILYMLRYGIVFLLTMFLAMSCTTSVSLSLEGKNLWIVQSLPITRQMLLKGKLAFNLVLMLPPAFVGCVCLAAGLRFSILTFLLYLLTAVSMVSFSTVLGMCFNLWFPKYEWSNENEVIKQGMAAFLGVLVNMFLQMILMGLAAAASFLWSGALFLLVISVVFLTISGLIYYVIMAGGEVIYLS